MIVVDSSVWIDFFRGAATSASAVLTKLLEEATLEIVIPDVVLYEVLRGFRHERDYRSALHLMRGFSWQSAYSPELALGAAQHYRAMVNQGFTIRSALDVVIGTFCIEHGYVLLHNDRDFTAMHDLRGLRVWSRDEQF